MRGRGVLILVFQVFSSRRKIHFPKLAGLGVTALVAVLVVTGFVRFRLDKNSATPQVFTTIYKRACFSSERVIA
jgi:hypothetical protein